jgi:acetolactate synthase-1/2/3 large subunit
LIDIPKDVTKQMVEYKPVENITVPSYQPTYKGNSRQIHHFWRHVEAAKKPVFVVGGGAIASNAAAEVREFVKISKIPIIQTLMGLGVYPIDGEYSLGMPGMHGTAYANYALNAADLLISIGMRFDDRITGKLDAFAKHAKIIHIDIDPAEINKCKHAHLPIIGDAVEVLKEIIAESASAKIPDFSAWHAEVSEWQKKYPLVYEDSESVLKPQKILQEMNKILKGNAVIAVDVGEHQMWSAQYLSHQHPRHWLSSSGLGTMGFGLPASIGAHYADPQKPSINISGDGGVQMNIQELGTIAAEKLPIKTFIFNNKYLGMVRQWQELFYEHRYSSVDLEMGQPDFVKLAEAYGILGLRCDNPKDLVKTLTQALNHPGPVVVDFVIAREAGVYPMVPAGGTVEQMIVFEDGSI